MSANCLVGELSRFPSDRSNARFIAYSPTVINAHHWIPTWANSEDTDEMPLGSTLFASIITIFRDINTPGGGGGGGELVL